MSGSFAQIRLLLLTAAGLWLVALGPAWMLAGGRGVEGLTYAVLLCAISGVVALHLASGRAGGQQALAGVLAGMGLRMSVVLVAALVLQNLRPDLGLVEFYVWLVPAYFVMLAVETRLLTAADRPATRESAEIGPGNDMKLV
jgi:hypothetical protein